MSTAVVPAAAGLSFLNTAVTGLNDRLTTTHGLEVGLGVLKNATALTGIAANYAPELAGRMMNMSSFFGNGQHYCYLFGFLADVKDLTNNAFLSCVDGVESTVAKVVKVSQRVALVFVNVTVPLSYLNSRNFLDLGAKVQPLVNHISRFAVPVFLGFAFLDAAHTFHGAASGEKEWLHFVNATLKLTGAALPLLIVLPGAPLLGLASCALDFYLLAPKSAPAVDVDDEPDAAPAVSTAPAVEEEADSATSVVAAA